jgi:hypothetical protein
MGYDFRAARGHAPEFAENKRREQNPRQIGRRYSGQAPGVKATKSKTGPK